jgi:hypothetical protein
MFAMRSGRIGSASGARVRDAGSDDPDDAIAAAKRLQHGIVKQHWSRPLCLCALAIRNGADPGTGCPGH